MAQSTLNGKNRRRRRAESLRHIPLLLSGWIVAEDGVRQLAGTGHIIRLESGEAAQKGGQYRK